MASPFLPPPNLAGIALTLPPQNPVVYADIAPAVDYVHQLDDGRISRTQRSISLFVLILNFASGNLPGHPATTHEVGVAEFYKAALVFLAMAPG